MSDENYSSLPEYQTWIGMRKRCSSPKTNGYEYYGGRGIRVCDRWNHSFLAFLEDMGRKPSPEYTIDRIDNDGNYELSNCRWSTQSDQAKNRRPRPTKTCRICLKPAKPSRKGRCHRCNEFLRRHAVEWSEEAVEQLKPRICVICGELTRSPTKQRCHTCYNYFNRTGKDRELKDENRK